MIRPQLCSFMMWGRGSGAGQHAADVHREDLLVHLVGGVDDRPYGLGDAGVVGQDVEAAVGLGHEAHLLLDLGRVGDIQMDRHGLGARRCRR